MKIIKSLRISLASIFCLGLMTACSSNPSSDENSENSSEGKYVASNPQSKQWNVSILLDLSNRIDPSVRSVNPSQIERDTAIVGEVLHAFKQEMEAKKAFRAKGRIKVFFDPIPSSPSINQLASKLDIDLSTLDNGEKKRVYDNIQKDFTEALSEIYSESLKSKNWIGADIWGFFKRKVKDLCIEPNHKNILVILTDGYIYHANSVIKDGNKYSYLLAKTFSEQGLRQNPNWEADIESKGFGLIAPRSDLEDLEVLVIGISPEPNHPEDEDLIEYTLGKWFESMGVKKFAIYGTDLPANTRKRIANFFQ